MAKLQNLTINEFSIVRGDDKVPANPEARALFYKAATSGANEEDMKRIAKNEAATAATQPAVTPAVVQPQTKSLGAQVAGFLQTLGLTKAMQTRTSEYNSVSKETWDDGQGTAVETATDGDGTTTIVIQQATQKAAPVAALATSQPATPAEGDVNPVTKAVRDAINPLAESVLKLDSRLAALEGRPVGSQQLSKSHGVEVTDNSGQKFPLFAKRLRDSLGLSPGQRLSKAVITGAQFAPFGLAVQEADQFIDYIVDQSRVLAAVRQIRMTKPVMNIDKIGLGGRVLVKGTAGVDPGDTVSITTPTQLQLSCKEVLAIVSLGDDSLEDNIEGDAFLQHLLGMISRSVANELDEAFIHGDTAVADTGVLDRWNGFYKLAKTGGANVIDAMTDTDRFWPGLNGGKATRLIKAIPTRFRRDLQQMAFLLHPDLYLDLNDELASKGYSDAFASITGIREVPLRGIRNVQVPLMRTNMAFTYAAQPYTDGTFVMLTDLRNLIVGILRDIRIEPQRFARKRCTDYVVTMRGDVQIENAQAIGLYDRARVRP